MINKTRISVAALATLLASTAALVTTSELAAARGSGHANYPRVLSDEAGSNTIRPTDNSRRHSHDRTLAKRKRAQKDAKNTVECIKAPCSLHGGDRHTKHGHMQSGSGNKGTSAGTSIVNKPPAVPGTAGNNTIHPIVTTPTTGASRPGATSVQEYSKSSQGKAAATLVAGKIPSVPSPGGNNTIHPIVTNKPAQPTAAAPTGTGRLPPSDPVGNTHPTAGANPPTVVTVSNGVNSAQILNGPGGVVVYSEKPGTITVDNGKEKTTLSGGSVTLSGNVMGVGAGQGIEVGKPNGEDKTVVAIKPTPEPPPLNRNSEDLRKGFSEGCGPCEIFEGINDFGYGIAHGFAPGPVPPPKTSTTTQQ